jgi:tryptophan-rich sensory protein
MNILQYVLPPLPLIIGSVMGRVCPIKRDQILGTGYIPPGWVFATMWSVIYAMIGVFIWYALQFTSYDPILWGLLLLNLLFNFTWSAIYSSRCAQKPDLAFWWIFACKLTILALFVRLLSNSSSNVRFSAIWLVLYACWIDVALLLSYQSLRK